MEHLGILRNAYITTKKSKNDYYDQFHGVFIRGLKTV